MRARLGDRGNASSESYLRDSLKRKEDGAENVEGIECVGAGAAVANVQQRSARGQAAEID